VPGKYRALSADANRFKSLASAHDESGPAILKPVGSIFVFQAHKMIVGPGRRSGTVLNARQILLVQITVTGKRAVRVRMVLPRVSVSRSSNQENTCRRRHLRYALGNLAPNTNRLPSALSRFPMASDLLIADKGAFVLAEEMAIGLRHQFFFHVINEGVFTRETDVLAVSGNSVIAAAAGQSSWGKLQP